jgi:hypothetical protein
LFNSYASATAAGGNQSGRIGKTDDPPEEASEAPWLGDRAEEILQFLLLENSDRKNQGKDADDDC